MARGPAPFKPPHMWGMMWLSMFSREAELNRASRLENSFIIVLILQLDICTEIYYFKLLKYFV